MLSPHKAAVSITPVNLQCVNPKLLTSVCKCSTAPLLHLIKPGHGVSRTDASTATQDHLLLPPPSAAAPSAVLGSSVSSALCSCRRGCEEVGSGRDLHVWSDSSGNLGCRRDLWPRLCWSTSINSPPCVSVCAS